MRGLILSAVLLVPALTASAAPSNGVVLTRTPLDDSLMTEKFSVGDNTAIPGTTLKSGNYVIRLLDHIFDRSIMRVEKEDGKVISTFLAVPNKSLGGSGQGPVVWPGKSGHDKALRGFNFPGSFSVEFVYPKEEAVKIALANSAAVEAIDPASDNLPSKQQKLTSDDMRIVTLWTLSPTRVDGSTGIAAEKYKPAIVPSATEQVVARNEPPAGLPAPRTPRSMAPAASVKTAPPPATRPAPIARHPLAAALPHTASSLPSILLLGMVAAFAGGSLRIRKQPLTT